MAKTYADWKKVQEILEEKTGLAYFNTTKDELICRCPKCELESTKDHGHLYISAESPVFNCFKCGFKGIVTKIFYELGLNPTEYLFDDVFQGKFQRRVKFFDIDKYKVPEINQDKNKLKRQYLVGRLGLDFRIENIPGLVFSASDFLMENNLDVLPHQKKMIPYLDENFIGFLCTRGKTIVFRNIDNSSHILHYKLFLGESGYFNDFYGIKSGVFGENSTIVLCEGIFDLLTAIKSQKLLEIREKSSFWASILGKQYYKGIISVLDYCKLPCADIIILSDSDMVDEEYKFILKHPSCRSVSVYVNKNNKDFGNGSIEPIRIDNILQINRRIRK